MSKVTFGLEDCLGIITLNDPPFNLLGKDLIDDLQSIMNELKQKSIRGLLLKSEGGNFSAGANMSLFSGGGSTGGREILDLFLGIVHCIETLPYPTLASVNGLCLGGGFELALACDLIWAADNAKLGSPEVSIGTIPLGAGSRSIAARAGMARAKEMVYEGKFYTAEKLEQWNIVNKILPESELHEQALKYIKKLSEGPTLAHAVTKRLHNEYYNHGSNSSDDLLLEIVPALFETNDFMNGVKSLMDNGPGKAKFNAS